MKHDYSLIAFSSISAHACTDCAVRATLLPFSCGDPVVVQSKRSAICNNILRDNRWHSTAQTIDIKTPRHACQYAASSAGIKKKVYPHVLRQRCNLATSKRALGSMSCRQHGKAPRKAPDGADR